MLRPKAFRLLHHSDRMFVPDILSVGCRSEESTRSDSLLLRVTNARGAYAPI